MLRPLLSIRRQRTSRATSAFAVVRRQRSESYNDFEIVSRNNYRPRLMQLSNSGGTPARGRSDIREMLSRRAMLSLDGNSSHPLTITLPLNFDVCLSIVFDIGTRILDSGRVRRSSPIVLVA